MASGWASLGRMLAGGGVDKNRIRAERFSMLADADRRVAEAGMKMDEQTQRLGLADSLIGAGYSPGEALMIATASRAGFNPQQLTGARGDLQEQRFRGGAVDAGIDMYGPNNPNAYLMGVASGPQDLAKIQGDVLLGNVFAPGGEMQGPTAVGQGRLGLMGAQASQAQAGAQENLAQALLYDAKRTNPEKFRAAGPTVNINQGTGLPVIRGPRGFEIVSTGDKTLDRQNYNRAQAGMDVLDTVDQLKAVSQDPRNFGATGLLRRTAQDLAQQGDAIGQVIARDASNIQSEIASMGHEIDPEAFDPNLPAMDLYYNILLFKTARSLNASGLLSNNDVKRAESILGNPKSMLGNQKSFAEAVKRIEAMTAKQMRDLTPQGDGNLPAALQPKVQFDQQLQDRADQIARELLGEGQ